MSCHPNIQREQEQRAALARIVHDMNSVLYFLRDADRVRHLNGINLELPSETAVLAVIEACAKIYQQPEAGA